MVDLASGDAAAAARRLGALWNESKEVGVVEPGENRYLGDLGEALVQLEDLAGAERLADELGALGDRLDRPSAAGVALRIRGLSSAARGERERAVTLMREAEAAHSGAGLPFEHARTLLALGTLERQARERRAARETLQQALERFERLDAALWSDLARSELGRIGGRAPSSGALTPGEERIAALVAEGRSNKEVAAELVVSVHTVEAALTSVYRKLDVRSRTALAHKLTVRAKD
jgi:DNA-binding CsgD family transcriptional regulator